MSAFDIRTDAPNTLRVEALNTNIKFDRTSPTTGRIIWNIPSPAAGCTSDSQAFCGILITLDTTPVNSKKKPIDGKVYSSDPTGDANLFSGDKLDTSLIIGAFYNDKITTSLDITDLKPNIPYYISGFPMDCQYRYFVEGIHTFSQDIANRGSDGKSGHQKIILNRGNPIQPSDVTNLDPNTQYTLDVQVGLIPAPKTPVKPYECVPQPKNYHLNIAGNNSTTYGELIDELNRQFMLINNPIQSPVAPLTGTLYLDPTTNKLFTWDGTTLTNIPAIVQDNQPNLLLTGSYWYNPTVDILYQYNGTTWVSVAIIKSNIDPLSAVANQSFWFNGTQGYVWNGTTWCEIPTYIQSHDPSTSPTILPGTYWYDSDDGILYTWDTTMDMWLVVHNVLEYEFDPNNLPNGTYWYDNDNNLLYVSNNLQWLPITNFVSSTTIPTNPTHGLFWYDTNGTLYEYDLLSDSWRSIPVLIYTIDPTIRSSCDTWWNVTTNELFVWNQADSLWVPVNNFYNQKIDPTTVSNITIYSLWYNPTTHTFYYWKNNCFVSVYVATNPTNPHSVVLNQIWHDTKNDKWYKFNGTNWVTFLLLVLDHNPINITTGEIWYSASSHMLQVWNGLMWASLVYTSTSPIPTIGTEWFNTTNNILYEWSNNNWVVVEPSVVVDLDCYGNMVFTDTSVGSSSFIRVKDGPQNPLFLSLNNGVAFGEVSPGTDGVSGIPSYRELGVGTDGSNDERLLMFNNIKYQLGYPVIDVELTTEQLDFCVTKAISELRAKSGLGYKHGYFFLYTDPESQRYLLTNKISGYNKIVNVLDIQRTNSLAIGGHDSGIYGQYFANFLYQVGHFDLLSYHLMTEYKKTFEILFAQRIQFNWNEQTRELFIHQRMPYRMYLAIEATVERSEQDLLLDRYASVWILRYATALARIILAEIRGKFSTLPGAGGGITLNANELRMAAKEELEACLLEIEMYQADTPEEYGMSSTFLFG